MRVLASTVALAYAVSVTADQLQFADVVEPTLVFRGEFNSASHYPHVINVFLRLENTHDSEVSWVASRVTGIEAELFDAAGSPVPTAPGVTSIRSSLRPFVLPFGSSLDWLISHGGISMMGNLTNGYALMVGSKGWLIPIDAVGSYSLRIRLSGYPWTGALLQAELGSPKVLLDLSPTKINLAE